MTNISQFKRKMQVGTNWIFRSNDTNGDQYLRTCTKRQSNSCALSSWKTKDGESSWIEWPKKTESIFLDGGVYIVNAESKDDWLELLKKGPVIRSSKFYLFYQPYEGV